MPSQDIQVLDGKVSVNPKPQHPSGFVQAGKCKLIIQIPAFDVAKMPLSSCSQSLGTINPVLPQKFRKPWKRIKASCLFTRTEQEKLKKYGPWLRALHNAKLFAKSKFEKHFESVCRRKIEPKYDIEAIWQRYIDCRLVETQMRRLHRNHVDYSR